MRWDILALIGIVFGFLLIVKGFDTLTEWRAWFFGIAGLVLFLCGILRIVLRVRRLRSPKALVPAKN
jgi:glucose dehydrogenase